ncbi:MAG: DUF305 domain-containing protein [Longimicrobiales bacterium]
MANRSYPVLPIGIVLLSGLAVSSCATRSSTTEGTSAAGSRVVQAGAPGRDSKVLSQADLATAVRPMTTEADIQFMQGMIPHHLQALEMTALVEARTESLWLRQMALRMEISQKDEIALMESWLAKQGETSAGGHGAHGPMPGMLTPTQMSELEEAEGERFERLFLEFMIQHHEGALTMVAELFATAGAGQASEVFQFANDVDVDQRVEIARMRQMLSGL